VFLKGFAPFSNYLRRGLLIIQNLLKTDLLKPLELVNQLLSLKMIPNILTIKEIEKNQFGRAQAF
jgi:hypothetical protein